MQRVVLASAPPAPDIDRSALVGWPVADRTLGFDEDVRMVRPVGCAGRRADRDPRMAARLAATEALSAP